MRFETLAGIVAVMGLTAGCHSARVAGASPRLNPDSIAASRARELARARQDSSDRVAATRREAERLAAQRRSDSLNALARRTEEARSLLASMIHFDFDKADLRQADMQRLNQKLPILWANPDVRIRIAGNCDERGSDEYNLTLGNRRALAAKRYLVDHGFEPSRIDVVSYGEERPIDPGHDEQAWAADRNDQFSLVNASGALTLPS